MEDLRQRRERVAAVVELLSRLSLYAFLGPALTEDELLRTHPADASPTGRLCQLARQACLRPALHRSVETNHASDHKEVITLTGGALAGANATAAVLRCEHLHDDGHPHVRLQAEKFGPSHGITSDLPIYQQPRAALATGVLVAPQIVATAAHVITGCDPSRLRLVFGYRMAADGSPPSFVLKSEIYSVEQIVGVQYDPAMGVDWALLKVDRKVARHEPVRIRRSRWPARGTPLHLVGHPWGIPCKYTAGGEILMDDALAYFHAELDVFDHDSGSPAFSDADGALEGIYDGGAVGSARVWIEHRARAVVFRLHDSPRPRFTRTAMFEHLIDPG